MPQRWMHDDETEYCLQCHAEFNPIRRKHHCRSCGRIYCDECSCQRLLIPREELVYPPPSHQSLMLTDMDPCEPQRVCYPCSGVLLPKQEELRRTMSKASQSNFINRESLERYLNAPLQFSLDAEIRKAAYTLFNFTADNAIEGADTIPRELIWGAKGLAFLTILKAGFFFTGRLGSGLVIGRLDDGSWSAPSAIGCTGVGWGFQLGGEVTDVIIVLNSKSALQAFASSAQVSLGTELSVSLGPLGRTAATDVHAGDKGVSAAFSYAHSKGFFVGVSLEAGLIVSRTDVNEAFYGGRVNTTELLMGRVPPPKAAEPLYQALKEVMGSEYDGYTYNPYDHEADAALGFGRVPRFGQPPSETSNPYMTRYGPAYTDEEYDRLYTRRNRTPFDDQPPLPPTRQQQPPGNYDSAAAAAEPRYHAVASQQQQQRGQDTNGYDRGLYEGGPAAAGPVPSGQGPQHQEEEDEEWMKERQRRLSKSREQSNGHDDLFFAGQEMDTFKKDSSAKQQQQLGVLVMPMPLQQQQAVVPVPPSSCPGQQPPPVAMAAALPSQQQAGMAMRPTHTLDEIEL